MNDFQPCSHSCANGNGDTQTARYVIAAAPSVTAGEKFQVVSTAVTTDQHIGFFSPYSPRYLKYQCVMLKYKLIWFFIMKQ